MLGPSMFDSSLCKLVVRFLNAARSIPASAVGFASDAIRRASRCYAFFELPGINESSYDKNPTRGERIRRIDSRRLRDTPNAA
jgi:hypothetical protein